LVLSSSFPSGKPNISLLREQLTAHCKIKCPAVFRPAVLPKSIPLSSLTVPVNAGFASGLVYIGSGCLLNSINPSPWGSPFGCSVNAMEMSRFRDYAFSRADVVHWLTPLVGKTFICSCIDNPNNHANTLRQLVLETFAVSSNSCPAPASCRVDEMQTSASSVYGGVLSLPGNHCSFAWESIQYVCQRPSTIAWPRAWSAMVVSMRNSVKPLFWELFAGCAELTKSFSGNLWVCGPPIDFTICKDFDLLNPHFVAIVIGLILENRVTLISLSPPYYCSAGACSGILTVCDLLVTASVRADCHIHLIMPERAQEWKSPICASFLSNHLTFGGLLDTCVFGTPWNVRYRIASSFVGLKTFEFYCHGGHSHCHFPRSTSEHGAAFSNGRLWPAMARQISSSYSPLKTIVVDKNVTHLAGLLGGERFFCHGTPR